MDTMDTIYEDATHVDEAHALGYEWCDMHRGYVDPDEVRMHIVTDASGNILLSTCDDCESGYGYSDYLDNGDMPGMVIMDELDPYEHDTTWY